MTFPSWLTLSNSLLAVILAVQALTLYALFFTRPLEDDDGGPLRTDLLGFTFLLILTSYLCHIKGW